MNRLSVLACALASVMLMPVSAGVAADPLRDRQWNLDAINADGAHRISVGSGALVAALDSGVHSSHPDLAGNVIDGRDFIDGDHTPDDQHGHGTNVAGIIVAHAENAIGVKGAAPGAKVLSIRVLDAQKRGNIDQEIAGIDAAVAAGAQVINLSLNPQLGLNTVVQLLPGDPLVQAIDRAARAGVVVVASAGNDGVPLCNQPILASKILCVGAVNRAGERASYSNYNVRVDLVAPGGDLQPDEAIVSAQRGGGFSAMAGTSQAAPHVAAAAALLVSLGLRGRAVIDRLEQTATPLGNALQLGHGLLNMQAAVAGLGPELDPSPQASSAALSARAPRRVRFSTLRKRGLTVTCTSPHAARCSVRVTSRDRVLARGSRPVKASVATAVRARLTTTGRQVLRRSNRVVARVEVTATGAGSVRLSTTLKR